MRQVVCEKYGRPEVLRMTEADIPEPADDEIRVRVHASSVTVADVRIRGFRVPKSYRLMARLALGFRRPRNPVLGVEYAGVVDSTGPQTTKFRPGDRVYGVQLRKPGGYAEYLCTREDGVIAAMPGSLEFHQAAVVPVGARTAWSFLDKADIREGTRVLVYGASGSVGTYAVQIAKNRGAEVTAVCSRANNGLVTGLGADHVIDYRTASIRDIGGSWDVILDAVGYCPFKDVLATLTPGGTFLHVVVTPLSSIMFRMVWHGMISRRKFYGGDTEPSAENLQEITRLIDSGLLKPVIDREYDLEEIVEAHRYVDEGHKKGNVAVRVLV